MVISVPRYLEPIFWFYFFRFRLIMPTPNNGFLEAAGADYPITYEGSNLRPLGSCVASLPLRLTVNYDQIDDTVLLY